MKLQYDKLLSRFAFKFNLRHYIVDEVPADRRLAAAPLHLCGDADSAAPECGGHGFCGYSYEGIVTSDTKARPTCQCGAGRAGDRCETHTGYPGYVSKSPQYRGRAVQVDSIKTRVQSAYGCRVLA